MSECSAIIADDEENLRSYLREMLAKAWPQLNIVGEAQNGNEALSLIRELKPDIAFLDIKMPGLTGISVASNISHECRVVFVTAYDDFAIKAFELEAIDYLLKPLERGRLEKTVIRLKQYDYSTSVSHDISEILNKLVHHEVNSTPYIRWIKASDHGKVFVVPVDEIIYLRTGDKYTSVITKTKEWLIKKPIKELEKELNPETFWRIHRSIIVNVANVTSASRIIGGRYELRIIGCKEILTTSRAYAHRFKQM